MKETSPGLYWSVPGGHDQDHSLFIGQLSVHPGVALGFVSTRTRKSRTNSDSATVANMFSLPSYNCPVRCTIRVWGVFRK
jgi:hypothetical protein